MTRAVFRADASLQIGSGHIMRCLTLADALRVHGVRCHFVSREHPGNLNDLVRQRGYEVSVLPAPEDRDASSANPAHAAWLGARWEDDAEEAKAALAGQSFDWLIVDHYALDARWERAVRPLASRFLVMDDLADRPHDCDLLLDQNLGRQADDYAGLVPADCELLVGPAFALLRPEFARARARSLARRRESALKRLLITMGGVDKDNVTLNVLDALLQCSLPSDCRITVVMGMHAPGLTAVQERAVRMPWLTEVLVNVKDMAALMVESDLAIGAAGSTSWERCCLGLPALLFVIADNQRSVARSLAVQGAVNLVRDEDLLRSLQEQIDGFVTDSQQLSRMSERASSVVDGDGILRVVKRVLFSEEQSRK